MSEFLDVIQGAQALRNLSTQAREQERQDNQQRDLREASDYLRKYKASVDAGTPDTDSLNEAILRSPELSQSVLSGIGLVDKQRQQKGASDIVELYAATDNPEMFNRVAARRVNDIMASGGDPKDTLSLVKTFNEQGAEAARAAIRPIGAAMVNQGLVKGELLGFGSGAEPMTAYQAASTDLRKQELEMRKQEKATETQLKVLEARMRKEYNELKKQYLQSKIDEQTQKLADMRNQKEVTKREKSAELKQAYFGIDNMLNTIARIESSDSLDSVIGSIQGRVDAYLDDDAAATIRLIENLGSQSFMAMIPGLKGMGALSNAEGDKLAASLQNLSRVTGEKQFRATLKEVNRLMNKSRKFLAERYGVEETAPDVPAAQPSEADIMKQYGIE